MTRRPPRPDSRKTNHRNPKARKPGPRPHQADGRPFARRPAPPASPVAGQSDPRAAVTLALADVANDWPAAAAMEPAFDNLADLRDKRLARAIWHVAIQRWFTLAHVLDGYLKQPLHQLEPLMQGVLLAGTAQLLFMDRLPAHAVVDESVTLARKFIRPGAGGLTNAVLRKIATLAESPVTGKAWTPAPDRLPLEDGYIPLAAPVLPAVPDLPASDDTPLDAPARHALAAHLEAATSHPAPLANRWIEQFGVKQAIALCLHGVVTPPVIVSVEPGLNVAAIPEWLAPHKQPGFAIWQGRHGDLPAFLQGHRARRVQDPASSLAVKATAALRPKLILDYCAGRGTKTRQLALAHPKAHVVASDTAVDRLMDLSRAVAGMPKVQIAHVKDLPQLMAADKADLLLLDVPCSNTAVLARRPGAKYRHDAAALQSLIELQREIIAHSLQWLARPGWLLYSTCSLDEQENQKQTAWILHTTGGKLLHEQLTLPQGRGRSYQDGSYHALIALT